MRKIPQEYDNAFDNLLIEISDKTAPYAYNLGMTPNFITTLSNISCIITVLLLFKAQYYWAAFFVILSYYFDCMDGHLARKYNMTTYFGDLYDHVSDVSKIILIFSTMYYINSQKFLKVIPILLLFLIFAFIHLGCQELLYDSDESLTLQYNKLLCPVKNPKNKKEIVDTLQSTKYFGCGTFFLALAISIIYYDY